MIGIGKVIYNLLTATGTTIYTIVGKKVYPLIIPENTQLPCIVYERNGNYEYSRDGQAIATTVVDITVLSEDYSQTINIAEGVFNILNMYSGENSTIHVYNTRLISVQETYAENAFIQKLTFEVKSI
ncbi:MAG: hypothetical protein GT598_15640 [Bacteroidales bacterium]|nr:hypothetical protein [Bacteroidales bacterium]